MLILKRDGTSNEFFSFANENTLPDYNIPKYLNALRSNQLNIRKKKLVDGPVLHIHEGRNWIDDSKVIGFDVSLSDDQYRISKADGKYLTEDKLTFFVIRNERIDDVIENRVKELAGGGSFEIHKGKLNPKANVGKTVSMNGAQVLNTKLIDNRNTIYTIEESVIKEVVFIVEYLTKENIKIVLEQRNDSKIIKGDIVIEYDNRPIIPDGMYKIKGKFWSIRVVDNKII